MNAILKIVLYAVFYLSGCFTLIFLIFQQWWAMGVCLAIAVLSLVLDGRVRRRHP